VSPKQLAANRANAAKSSGPRTHEGKSRSAQNARKHGFAAEAYSVVRLEDIHAVANLRADAIAVYQPINSQELFAVERIAITQLAILRAARLEAGFFTSCLNEMYDLRELPKVPLTDDLTYGIEVAAAQNRNFLLAEGFKRNAVHSNAFTLHLRYSAHAERQYRRAIEEFERLKALRPELGGADLPVCPPDELRNEPISEPEAVPEQPEAPPIAVDETNPFPPEPQQREGVPPIIEDPFPEPAPPALANG
jgi:hypothetical protein